MIEPVLSDRPAYPPPDEPPPAGPAPTCMLRVHSPQSSAADDGNIRPLRLRFRRASTAGDSAPWIDTIMLTSALWTITSSASILRSSCRPAGVAVVLRHPAGTGTRTRSSSSRPPSLAPAPPRPPSDGRSATRAMASSAAAGDRWPSPPPAQAVEVHDFWFGGDPAKDNGRLWWSGGPEIDAEVTRRFGPLVEAAVGGSLPSEWDAHPLAACAKVILLDQFSRNVFRGSTKAFAGDAAAQRMAQTIAGNAGYVYTYTCFERNFAVILPLMHSEVLANHELAAELLSDWIGKGTEEEAKVYGGTQGALLEHTRVVRRFGRYPSRNASLGRPATAEEEEYMRTEAKGWELSQAKS